VLEKHHIRLFFLLFSVAFAFYLSRQESLQYFLLHLGSLGYVGAFFAGILFVWIFTMPIGLLILLTLSSNLAPIEIGLIGGLGAVFGDLVIFKLVKDSLANNVSSLYKKHGQNHISHVFKSKYFHWTLPVIGAIIIASPFPDEVGVSLMGISKMGTYKFMVVSFILNSLGIYLTILAGGLIRSF
jgi:hypothetical protein